jgi:hypothetical protein
MRSRILLLVLLLGAAPAAAWAQVGFRTAAQVEHRLSELRSFSPTDLFLARPDTYAPRQNGRSIYDIPFTPIGPWYTELLPARSPRDTEHPSSGYERCAGVVRGCPISGGAADDRGARGAESPSTAAVNDVIPVAPGAPGPPKTFFVITGCYAGDRPPRKEWLAPGCDPARVRTVGP